MTSLFFMALGDGPSVTRTGRSRTGEDMCSSSSSIMKLTIISSDR
jgi:hypothetical protein